MKSQLFGLAPLLPFCAAFHGHPDRDGDKQSEEQDRPIPCAAQHLPDDHDAHEHKRAPERCELI